MISYIPKHIYIDPEVLTSPITKNILRKFPEISYEVVSGKPKSVKEVEMSQDPLLEGKKRLWITKNKGKLVRRCGAATSSLDHLVCCNYFILDFSFNCHFECVYCFLQEYTNLPLMVVYANVDEMLISVRDLISQSHSPFIRIGTGEMADSLALDSITEYSKYLVPFFAEQKRAILELKTKSDQIQNLLAMDPQGQTVIAWSINPPQYIKEYDLKTASLEERFSAADQCQKAGYKIAFHLDPLIYEPSWKEDYLALVQRIYEQFNPVWVSLGALRFNANLKTMIQKRFPKTRLTTGEFITAPDGKKRYLRMIREEMYQTVHRYIQKENGKTPIYLCMENNLVWRNAIGGVPTSEKALESHIVGFGFS